MRYLSVLGCVMLALFTVATAPVWATPDGQPVISGYGRAIRFSGYEWLTKTANVLVGPGPNYFSDAKSSAWTDDRDRLHLRIRQDDAGHWQAAEVVLQPRLGYGTYRFVVDAPINTLDRNVVLGLFTWSDDPAQHHRELDIEFSRWGDPDAPAGRFSVQPFQTQGNEYSFDAAAVSSARTIHTLHWTPGRAAFASADEQDVIAAHVFTQGIPESSDEQVRINLWLDAGRPPSDGNPVEIVIESFTFEPANSGG